MATARSIRSNAAPASNRPHTKHQSSSRPELRVVSNPRGNEQGNVVGRVIEWTRTRSAPLVHVAIAVIFLVGTLFGALMLRTQMVQNSFEAAQIETKISKTIRPNSINWSRTCPTRPATWAWSRSRDQCPST